MSGYEIFSTNFRSFIPSGKPISLKKSSKSLTVYERCGVLASTSSADHSSRLGSKNKLLVAVRCSPRTVSGLTRKCGIPRVFPEENKLTCSAVPPQTPSGHKIKQIIRIGEYQNN